MAESPQPRLHRLTHTSPRLTPGSQRELRRQRGTHQAPTLDGRPSGLEAATTRPFQVSLVTGSAGRPAEEVINPRFPSGCHFCV